MLILTVTTMEGREIRKRRKVFNSSGKHSRQAYSLRPNVGYKLRVDNDEKTWGEEEVVFILQDGYGSRRCGNHHEARTVAPSLVMGTATMPFESKNLGRTFNYLNLAEEVTFKIETTFVSCEICDSFSIKILYAELCDDRTINREWFVYVPFVLELPY